MGASTATSTAASTICVEVNFNGTSTTSTAYSQTFFRVFWMCFSFLPTQVDPRIPKPRTVLLTYEHLWGLEWFSVKKIALPGPFPLMSNESYTKSSGTWSNAHYFNFFQRFQRFQRAVEAPTPSSLVLTYQTHTHTSLLVCVCLVFTCSA